MDNNNTELALQITKALANTENGGTPDVSNLKEGKTGEAKSIFQFTPNTFKAYSKETLGQEVPLTPENESQVAFKKVSGWLSKGYTGDQIASMWNAGVGEPDAYTGKFSDGSSSSGTNKKYGVKYDVPGYVKKFNTYLDQIKTQPLTQNTQQGGGTEQPQASQPQAQPPQAQQPQQSPQLAQAIQIIKPLLAKAQGSPAVKASVTQAPVSALG